MKSPDKRAPGETCAQGYFCYKTRNVSSSSIHPFSDEPTVPQLAGMPGFKFHGVAGQSLLRLRQQYALLGSKAAYGDRRMGPTTDVIGPIGVVGSTPDTIY